MRNIICNLAVSVDGYIARPDGRVDWLDDLDTDGSDLGFQDFLDSCDTIIMGRTSYDVTLKLGHGVWPFLQHQTYVFTSSTKTNQPRITFVNDHAEEFIRALKQKKGKDIWLFGGASLIQSLREFDLVDQYLITYIPKLIGDGIKLFTPTTTENELEVLHSTTVKNIVTVLYQVVHNTTR